MRAWIAWASLALGLAAAFGAQAAVVDPRVLVVTVTVAGRLQDGPEAGNYYVAFNTTPHLLSGPEPDGRNWSHYLLLQRRRFFFAAVRVPDPPPLLFRFTLPPEPYTRASLAADGRTFQAEIPLTLLGALHSALKVNVVTTDRGYRVLDALGAGSGDALGFVRFDPSRELYRQFQDPEGDAPADYDVVTLTLRVQVP
ncbi:hypothetical protein HRbin32_01262 [bacterium HR32]|nr:hypothetical protein HRbin32_01262 [bacterium HR32]